MNFNAEIIARLSGEAAASPFFLPDLTLWYAWRKKYKALPAPWQSWSLPQICRAMGLPIWHTVRPWQVSTPGLAVTTTETGSERVIRGQAPSGELTARWQVGPDGDWWQTEYLVKSEADFAAAIELAQARTYTLDDSHLAPALAEVGDDGVVALELPRRPYADILHEFLGWSEGLMFLADPAVAEINQILEGKIQALVEQVALLPAPVVLSPDNLDGQFIPPRTFDQFLTHSYAQTAQTLHRHNKRLVVHVGGPVKHLLPKLAQAGADCVEGVSGPPQGDVMLTEARETAGPQITLWGGIAQDYLLNTYSPDKFEAAVAAAAQVAAADSRAIIGIADRVPVDVNLERLQQIARLMGS
jgi:hypothetical protein